MEVMMEDVFELYQKKVALLSSAQREKLYQARDSGMSPFVIGCAILRAKQEQKRSQAQGKRKHISFNYIQRIIEDWLNHGITTEEEFRSFWAAIQADNLASERGGQVEQTAEKIQRKDFKYEAPKYDKEFFSFLDE